MPADMPADTHALFAPLTEIPSARLRPTCPNPAFAADVDAIERACSQAGFVTFGDVYNFIMLYRQGLSWDAVMVAIQRRREGRF